MDEWFYARLGEKIICRIRGDERPGEYKVRFVKPDCVCLEDTLTVKNWVPFAAIDLFREPLS